MFINTEYNVLVYSGNVCCASFIIIYIRMFTHCFYLLTSECLLLLLLIICIIIYHWVPQQSYNRNTPTPQPSQNFQVESSPSRGILLNLSK